jgi:hypothetical protein
MDGNGRNELLISNITRSKNLELISETITIEGEKKMKIAAYYRPPKQVVLMTRLTPQANFLSSLSFES